MSYITYHMSRYHVSYIMICYISAVRVQFRQETTHPATVGIRSQSGQRTTVTWPTWSPIRRDVVRSSAPGWSQPPRVKGSASLSSTSHQLSLTASSQKFFRFQLRPAVKVTPPVTSSASRVSPTTSATSTPSCGRGPRWERPLYAEGKRGRGSCIYRRDMRLRSSSRGTYRRGKRSDFCFTTEVSMIATTVCILGRDVQYTCKAWCINA